MAIGNNKKRKILALSVSSKITKRHERYLDWIPAYAGMTVKKLGNDEGTTKRETKNDEAKKHENETKVRVRGDKGNARMME